MNTISGWRLLIFHNEENKNINHKEHHMNELTGCCPQSGVHPEHIPLKHRLHPSRITQNAYRTWERPATPIKSDTSQTQPIKNSFITSHKIKVSIKYTLKLYLFYLIESSTGRWRRGLKGSQSHRPPPPPHKKTSSDLDDSHKWHILIQNEFHWKTTSLQECSLQSWVAQDQMKRTIGWTSLDYIMTRNS